MIKMLLFVTVQLLLNSCYGQPLNRYYEQPLDRYYEQPLDRYYEQFLLYSYYFSKNCRLLLEPAVGFFPGTPLQR